MPDVPDVPSDDTPSGPRRLVLVRHAKAERERVLGDAGRALTDVGITQAGATARWLTENGVGGVDLALVSPATRTDQTWRILASAVLAGEVRVVEELYATSAQGLLAMLAEVDDAVASVLVVGHEPVLSRAAAALADASSRELAARVGAGIRPATAVVLALSGAWSDLAGGTCEIRAVSPGA